MESTTKNLDDRQAEATAEEYAGLCLRLVELNEKIAQLEAESLRIGTHKTSRGNDLRKLGREVGDARSFRFANGQQLSIVWLAAGDIRTYLFDEKGKLLSTHQI